MQHKDRIIVSAIIVTEDDKVFMGRTHPGGVYPDCWHIPGGGVDPGETKLQALIREVKEETGIDISKFEAKLVSDTDTADGTKIDKITGEPYTVTMHFNDYLVKINQLAATIKVILNDDLISYEWVPITNLKNYQLTPPSIKLFHDMGWI